METEQKEQVQASGAVTCEQELALLKDKLAYLTADMTTMRRHADNERKAAVTRAQEKILLSCILIMDDLERAFADLATDASSADQARYAGFELIYKGFKKMLAEYEVTEVPTEGQFDPVRHEALMQIAAEGKQPGDIVNVLQKGYMFKGTVLRPARVSVAL